MNPSPNVKLEADAVTFKAMIFDIVSAGVGPLRARADFASLNNAQRGRFLYECVRQIDVLDVFLNGSEARDNKDFFENLVMDVVVSVLESQFGLEDDV